MVSKNGWSFNELYQLTIPLREWYFNMFTEEVEQTNEAMEEE
jgi:hypothetical protein